MHYSEKLKLELIAEQEKILKAKIAIIEFRTHLCSPKFYKDTTIQISEVLNWLDNIVKELN